VLSDHTPVPTLAVTDLQRARDFYERTLGFAPEDGPPEGAMYKAGGGAFFVYPSAYAGTNKATAMSFGVPADAFDDEVAHLRRHGITFQTFDLPGTQWQDGVAHMGPSRSVWFADPDGNILNVETTG
jgi:catechol 2,3-dioxygenase-like lactoylglutathione lyase family enzyme